MRMMAMVTALAGLVYATPVGAAPVPADSKTTTPAAPATGASTPRLLVLRPGADGKVRVQVMRNEARMVAPLIAIAPGGGAQAQPVPVQQAINVRVPAEVELTEVKDLTVHTTTGKSIPLDEAAKRLSAGGVVIVSGDGKPVDPAFLGLFKEGTLVLASPELAAPEGMKMGAIGGMIQVAPAAPAVKPLPAPGPNGAAPAVLPAPANKPRLRPLPAPNGATEPAVEPANPVNGK